MTISFAIHLLNKNGREKVIKVKQAFEEYGLVEFSEIDTFLNPSIEFNW